MSVFLLLSMAVAADPLWDTIQKDQRDFDRWQRQLDAHYDDWVSRSQDYTKDRQDTPVATAPEQVYETVDLPHVPTVTEALDAYLEAVCASLPSEPGGDTLGALRNLALDAPPGWMYLGWQKIPVDERAATYARKCGVEWTGPEIGEGTFGGRSWLFDHEEERARQAMFRRWESDAQEKREKWWAYGKPTEDGSPAAAPPFVGRWTSHPQSLHAIPPSCPDSDRCATHPAMLSPVVSTPRPVVETRAYADYYAAIYVEDAETGEFVFQRRVSISAPGGPIETVQDQLYCPRVPKDLEPPPGCGFAKDEHMDDYNVAPTCREFLRRRRDDRAKHYTECGTVVTHYNSAGEASGVSGSLGVCYR